jgi:replication initiation protein
LNVPKRYRPGSIDQKILNPTAEYLAPYFMNFRITKNYSKGIRGRKLVGYTFTFRPESKTQKDVGYNKRIEETTHLYSIMTNTFLTTEQKFRAIYHYR